MFTTATHLIGRYRVLTKSETIRQFGGLDVLVFFILHPPTERKDPHDLKSDL